MNDGFNVLDYRMAFAQPRRVAPTTWGGHVPFGMAIVEMTMPSTIVELGTFSGVAYCAFCQTVSALQMQTKCFAVDTWAGDEHSGIYGDDVLADLRAHHDPLYSSFSTLMKMTFDDASNAFTDGTVDLLHIDGLHTYGAVKHDFETWLPKMSPKGIILFHDTQVRERDFGVHRLWSEVSRDRMAFEFEHSYGLGVLSSGSATPKAAVEFFELGRARAQEVRELYAALGGKVQLMVEAELAKIAARGAKPPGIIRRVARAVRAIQR